MASGGSSFQHRTKGGGGHVGRVPHGFFVKVVACLVVLLTGLLAVRRAIVASEYRSLRQRSEAFNHEDVGDAFDDDLTVKAPVAVSPQEFQITRIAPASPLDHLTQPRDTPLRIALLMSFPNSGTSYTTKLIRHVSLTHTASNYGHENRDKVGPSHPVFLDQPTGPFWIDAEYHPEYAVPASFVLTKTHCGMRCVSCPPDRYVETTFSFRRRCFVGKRSTGPAINGTTTTSANATAVATEAAAVDVGRYAAAVPSFEEVEYDDRRVSKAVHLIRNPFDNVVSRFRMERHDGKSATEYPSTREGFRDFCRLMNEDLLDEESRAAFLADDVLDILRDVPCRSDFIRYVEWHNLAFATTHDLGLETLVLQYDSYTTDFDATVTLLLEFLNLERVAEPEPFIQGKEYREYFTPSEQESVRKALEILASKTAWKEMGNFFT